MVTVEASIQQVDTRTQELSETDVSYIVARDRLIEKIPNGWETAPGGLHCKRENDGRFTVQTSIMRSPQPTDRLVTATADTHGQACDDLTASLPEDHEVIGSIRTVHAGIDDPVIGDHDEDRGRPGRMHDS